MTEKMAYFHVLPNLAVRDEPEVWKQTYQLLLDRGLTKFEALRRIRFAYTGDLNGDLPSGIA